MTRVSGWIEAFLRNIFLAEIKSSSSEFSKFFHQTLNRITLNGCGNEYRTSFNQEIKENLLDQLN